MNIIVPREENVDSVIIDLRDVVNGMELQDDAHRKFGEDILKPAEYTAYLFYIPRHLFVNKGQNADYDTIVKNIQEQNIPKVEKYIEDIDFFRELIRLDERNRPAFEHTKNLQRFFDFYGYKIIELPKNKAIIVGAPLWSNSVQLIRIKTSAPFKNDEKHYGKVNDVVGVGISDHGFALNLKDYVDGYGMDKISFKQYSRMSKREKARLDQDERGYER